MTDSIGRLGNGAKTVFSFRRAVRELGRRLERILWIMCYGRRGGAWVYFGVVGKDRLAARGAASCASWLLLYGSVERHCRD